MGRSKKSGMNWLAWRLNNPEKAQANDEAYSAFEQEVTGRVMACRTCGTQRVAVPASDVPDEVRATLEKSTKITEFVYCPTCKNYSGMGEWSSM
jgi:uncharacterized protein with PIN domain